MEKEKFKINLFWETLTKIELKEYVEEMHEYLLASDTSAIKQMIISLNKLCLTLRDDIESISDGNPNPFDLQILSSDKDDKTFDKLMKIVEKVKYFKEINEMAETYKPEILKKEQDDAAKRAKENGTALEIKGGNVFETLQLEAIKKGRT